MSVRSDFSADFAEAAFDTEDGLAMSATYTPNGGSPSSVTVIFQDGEDLEDARWGTALQASATLRALKSEVASWDKGDTFTLDGETWSIEEKLGSNAVEWKFAVRRDLRFTFKK